MTLKNSFALFGLILTGCWLYLAMLFLKSHTYDVGGLSNSSDYEVSNTSETQIKNDKPTMTKLQNMRAIEIPPFRAVSSGAKTFSEIFGEGGFLNWVKANDHLLKKQIYDEATFLWHEGEKETWGRGLNTWILAVRDDVTETDTAPYEIITFPGGMFLVATADEKDNDDLNETVNCMFDWINNSKVFEYGDFPKSGMCNMPNADGAIDKALGIAQQQIFLPLKFRQPQTTK